MAHPQSADNQAFLGRTFATSAAVDAAIEKLTTPDINAALRKCPSRENSYAFAGDFDEIVPLSERADELRQRGAMTAGGTRFRRRRRGCKRQVKSARLFDQQQSRHCVSRRVAAR
jgi:hypothetical protein